MRWVKFLMNSECQTPAPWKNLDPRPLEKFGPPWKMFDPSGSLEKYSFTDCSKTVLLLWIFYVFLYRVDYAFVHVCLYALWSPAGKELTSWLSFVVPTVSLSLSHWYPGSGVVLDCIDC